MEFLFMFMNDIKEGDIMLLQPPRGTRDLIFEEAQLKQHTIDTMRKTSEKWSFKPIISPILEYYEILNIKEMNQGIKEEIYEFHDKSGRHIGLRYEHTIQFARILANQLKNHPLPIKRYAIGDIFRYDRPQRKRYREFTQADIDIVGYDKNAPELLFIITKEIFSSLNMDISIEINDRKLLHKFCQQHNIKDEEEFLREIDKFDKITQDEKEKILSKFALGFEDFQELSSYPEYEEINSLSKMFPFLKFNPFLARGLSYYDGLIFEVKTENENLSLGGGGEYSKLLKAFGINLNAIGIGFGVDRILDILKNSINLKKPKILIVLLDKFPYSKIKWAIEKIEKRDWELELFLKKKLPIDYARKRNIQYVCFIGKKEMQNKKIKVKDLEKGEEFEI